MYRKSYEIVGYTYEAGIHCPGCAEERFGEALENEKTPPMDMEGNLVTPVFLDQLEGEEYCDDCLEPIE